MSEAPNTADDAEAADASVLADGEVAAGADAGEDPVTSKARTMGWDPAKGPLSAEEFVKRGEEIGGFIKKHNEKLERELAKANKEIAEMKGALTEATEFFSKSEERAYKAALKDIEARLDAAVDAGDNAGAREIAKEAADLAADMKPAPLAANPNADIETARDAWIADNDWFEKDADMRTFAIGVGESIKGQIEPLKQFAEITRRVKAAFPAKFENPRRRDAAAVEGGQRGTRSGTKGWADLPPEAKAQADRFIKSGIVKDRDTYARKYDWS